MKNINKLRLIGVLFCFLMVFLVIRAYGQDPETIQAVIEIAREAERLGLDCALYARNGDCYSLERCNRTKDVLKRTESGTEGAFEYLQNYINSSSLQRDCVKALTRGQLGQLEHLLGEAIQGFKTKREREGGGGVPPPSTSAVVLESSPKGSGTNWLIK